MKTYRKIIAILLAVGLVLPGAGLVTFAEEVENVRRLAGADRYKTAVAVSEETYKGTADAVVLAGGMAEVDALTGTLLAAAKSAPLLYTNKAALTAETKAEIAKLAPTTVYVLGGKAAVEEAVVTELKTLGYTVKRVEGLNRQATAAAVAEEANFAKGHAFIVRDGVSSSLVDALAVAPASYKMKSPVFLTKHGALHPETKEALKGYTSVTVIGGETAVSKAVETELAEMGLTVNTRVYGLDRDKTAVAIANKYFAGATQAVLANGHGKTLVDALVGGYLGGMKDAPVLYTKVDQIPTVTADFVEELNSVYMLGGTTVMSAALETAVGKLLEVDELKVVSVSATSAKKLAVQFNKAVEDEATFVVKRGTVTTNIRTVTWNDNKTVATLEAFTAFPAGDYTVEVAGLTGTVKVEAQKVASIEVIGDSAVLTGAVGTATTATVNFRVLDQYGNDATTTFGSTLTPSTTATHATTPIAISGNEITLQWAAAPAIDTYVVVNLIDVPTGVVGTKTLKVALESKAAGISLSELKNKDNKVLRTNTNLATDVFAFDVNAVDQYGKEIKLASQLASDYLLALPSGVSANFVNGTATTPATLKVTAVPALAGSYTITIVSKATGASTTATVVVEKQISIDTLTLTTPSDLYILNEYVYIPFSAVDQYGNPLTKFADINGNVVLSSTNATKYPIALEKDPVTGNARIKLSTGTGAVANDMVVITSVANGKSSTITMKLWDAAVPTRIASLSSTVARKMVVGATSTLAHTNFTIKDQYERNIALPASWNIQLVSATTANVTAGAAVTTSNTQKLTGIAAGSSVITATLNDGTSNKANSSLEIVAETVAKTNLTGFEISVADKVFLNATAWASANDEEKAYAVDMKVFGLTAAGERVALDQTIGGADIVNISSTNGKVDLTSTSGKLYAYGSFAAGVTEENATIVAVVKGANDVVTTVTKNVTLTNAAKTGSAIEIKAPAAGVVSFADGVVVMTGANVSGMANKIMSSHEQYTSSNRATVYFEIKDQYGVASATVAPAFYTISAKDAAGTAYTNEYTINSATGQFGIAHTPASGDEITVTAITNSGVLSTVKIIVQ